MADTTVFEQHESELRGYCRVYPTVFSSARNARQFDEDGKSYIDFFAGAGVLNFGHNNPRMKKALIEFIEADGVAHSLDTYTSAKREFISAFVDTVLKPRAMDYRLQFIGPTGTNAVEASLKLARKVTGRRNVVAFSHGFHGMTLGSLACTTNNYFRNAAGVPLENVTHQAFGCDKLCMGCRLGCGRQSLDQLRAAYADSSSGLEKPAAFLVEAIQAEGGVNVASDEWLQDLQSLAREVGALLIVDDIQVGCGRTGDYFSFERAGIDPDIVNLAKGIGGYGTPLAMNLVKPEHDRHWQPGEHTGTFRGQGLSFVAGREGLRYFEDRALLDEVVAKGEFMAATLNGVVERHGESRCQRRGRGMIQALDTGAGEHAKAIVANCFEAGLLVSACGTGGRVVKLIPPLTIEQETLAEGLAIFTRVVDQVLSGGNP
ncbi:MAG: aspartate aminotransferase family protein [Wenzhouxiangella sp.]|nr:MAG: aspartate aminotransferase family protein [Wenzhouxiangella sp.]